jgi:hypothetical protein
VDGWEERPCDGWNDDDLGEDNDTDNLVALRSSLILDPSELLRCRCRGCRWCGCCDDAIREVGVVVVVVVVVAVVPCFDFRVDDGEGDDDEHDDERGDLDCDRDTLLPLLLLLLLLLLVGVVAGSSMWVTRRTREDDDDDGDRTRDVERGRERVDGSCCCGSFLDSFLWLRVLVTRCCCSRCCCSVGSSVGFLWRVRDLDKLRALRRSVVGNIQRSLSLLLQHTLPPLCVF